MFRFDVCFFFCKMVIPPCLQHLKWKESHVSLSWNFISNSCIRMNTFLHFKRLTNAETHHWHYIKSKIDDLFFSSACIAYIQFCVFRLCFIKFIHRTKSERNRFGLYSEQHLASLSVRDENEWRAPVYNTIMRQFQ